MREINTRHVPRWLAPIGGTALALSGLFGLLPDGWLAFAVSLWAVLLWPGWLLSAWITRLPTLRRIPIAFLMSIGLLCLPAIALVRLETDLAVLTWVVGLLVSGLTAAWVFFGKPAAVVEDEPPDVKSLVPALLVAVCLLVIWAYQAPISDEGDHWFYLHFIRHFLDVGLTADLNPLAGQSATAGTLLRASLNSWWTLQAVVYRASGLALMDAYWFGLPPFLMTLSLLSTYGLGLQLFKRSAPALSGVIFQGLYLVSSIGSHSWAGNGFFLDIAEDKYVVMFILLPAALTIFLRLVENRSRGNIAAFALCWPALALTHPMAALQLGAAVGGWLILWLLDWLAGKRFGRWFLVGGAIFMLAGLPLLAETWIYRPVGAEISQAPPFISQTILLDGERGQFIANPHVIAHPLVLLGIGLSFLLLPRFREREGRFLLGVTWLPLVLAFHPFYAALLGRASGVWLAWRIVWVLPVALILARTVVALRIAAYSSAAPGLRRISGWIPLALWLLLGVLLRNYLFDSAGLLQDQKYRFVPVEEIAVMEALGRMSGPGDVTLAPLMLNTHLPAFNPEGKLLTSRLTAAKDGLFDKIVRFYSLESMDEAAFELLDTWDVRYVILPAHRGPDGEARSATQFFTLKFENDRYVLFEIHHLPEKGEWAPRPRSLQPADFPHPNPAENALTAGNRFRETGRLDEALEAFENVLAFNPEIFLLSGTSGAREAFGRSLIFDRRADRIAEALLGMGAVYEARGQYDQAGEVYTRLIALLPDREAGYAALEQALAAGGKPAEIFPVYEHAVRTFFWLTWPKVRLADAYFAAGQTEEAVGQLQEVLHLTPRDVFTLVRLARIFRVERSLDLALSYGLRALSYSTRIHELAQSHYELGQIYWARGDLEPALVNFLEPARLLPDLAVHHATIGDFYRMALNDPAGSLPYYREAVLLAPGNAQYFLALGDVYGALSDFDSARDAYAAAEALDPNLPGLQDRITELP